MMNLKNPACGDLINEIYSITNDVASNARPVTDANMVFRWPPRGLRAEINATVGTRNRYLYSFKLYLNSLFQWCLDRFDISAGGYRAGSTGLSYAPIPTISDLTIRCESCSTAASHRPMKLKPCWRLGHNRAISNMVYIDRTQP